MLLHSVIYVFIVTAWLANIVSSESAVEGCVKSLTLGKGGQASSFSASSSYGGYHAKYGRRVQATTWIPKLYNALDASNPDFLQIDLGSSRTITAVDTSGYNTFYVKKFQVWFSQDGKTFSLLQTGNTNASFSIVSCPIIVR